MPTLVAGTIIGIRRHNDVHVKIDVHFEAYGRSFVILSTNEINSFIPINNSLYDSLIDKTLRGYIQDNARWLSKEESAVESVHSII